MSCTVETYKDHAKVTFAKGASLEDPDRLFNFGTRQAAPQCRTDA